MEIITDCISNIYSGPIDLLDIGCGAGNYSVRTLQKIDRANLTLVDLSMPMLQRAQERTSLMDKGEVTIIKGDFRSVPLPESGFDVIIATAVLHHLRDDQDWEAAFSRLYSLLKPGGSLWIFDLVEQRNISLQHVLYDVRYGEYLTALQDASYRQKVFEYIAKEDSPRSVMYQLELMKACGFKSIDILHKHLCFASFVGFK